VAESGISGLARAGPACYAKRMSFPRIAAILPLLALSAPIAARSISEGSLARHIDVLASDAYEGRKPGTPGALKAITYIAGAFRQAGLSPAAADGSWYQPVQFVERIPARSTARFGGREEAGIALTGRIADASIADARVVFAGYGLPSDPAELSQADVRGAVVLIRAGAPQGVEKPLRMAERIKAMVARGAVAVITILPETAKWADARPAATRPTTALADTPRALIQGMMSQDAFARIAAGPVRSDLGRASLDVATTLRPFTSWNVIGRRAGTSAHGETVLFTGHWDHLGLCGPEGAADRICNGAVDNASGIASLIETARALGEGAKPVRDELFIATTGEEMGLLGMDAWANAPTVPLDRVVAAINVDTVAIAPRGMPVAIVGRGLTRLDPIVDATARRLGRKVDADLEANAFIDRQDGAVLVRRGVPAVMIGGSFSDLKRLEAFLGSVYHKPSDNPGKGVVLGGAAEDADLTVAVARTLVDPAAYSAR
jgi:hypothetical protein